MTTCFKNEVHLHKKVTNQNTQLISYTYTHNCTTKPFALLSSFQRSHHENQRTKNARCSWENLFFDQNGTPRPMKERVDREWHSSATSAISVFFLTNEQHIFYVLNRYPFSFIFVLFLFGIIFTLYKTEVKGFFYFILLIFFIISI